MGKSKMLILVGVCVIICFFNSGYSEELVPLSQKVETPKTPYPDLQLQVSVSPGSFKMHTPATFNLVFKNSGSDKILCSAIMPGSIVLSVIEGEQKNVRILIKKNPFGGMSNSYMVQPGKEEMVQYPLWEIMKIDKGGRYVFSYQLELSVNSKSQNLYKGTFEVDVKEMDDLQLSGLLSNISQKLKEKDSKKQALQELLSVSSAKSLPVLFEAWTIFEDSYNREYIVKAMHRTESDEVFAYLNKCWSSAKDEKSQLLVIHSTYPYRNKNRMLKQVEELCMSGLSSHYENVRESCVLILGYDIKPVPVSKLNELSNDPSPKVRQAVQEILKKLETESAGKTTPTTSPSPSLIPSTTSPIKQTPAQNVPVQTNMDNKMIVLLVGLGVLIIGLIIFVSRRKKKR